MTTDVRRTYSVVAIFGLFYFLHLGFRRISLQRRMIALELPRFQCLDSMSLLVCASLLFSHVRQRSRMVAPQSMLADSGV